MTETATCSTAATRRRLLRRVAGLTIVGSAALPLLDVFRAYADDGDHAADDKHPRPAPPPNPRPRLNSFSSDLIRVAASATSGDFTSTNPGTDPLQDGRVRLRRRGSGTDEGRVEVELRGAAPEVSYDVLFWPATSGKSRESLGAIGPTNKDGNLHDLTPTALSGTNRVGLIVITRHDGSEAGKDEFISSMGG